MICHRIGYLRYAVTRASPTCSSSIPVTTYTFHDDLAMTLLNSDSRPVIDILLVGLGSIGTVYAYILEKSGRARVTAVARSNYGIYSSEGVTVDTDRFGKIENWKPYRVVKSQAEAFEDASITYDICLLTTKSLPDVLPNSTLLAPAIASGRVKAFSLIQNGLAVEADLYKATRNAATPIISSLAWIGIMTSPDGKIVSWRGQDKMVSGLYAPPSGVKGQLPSFNDEESAALEQWHSILLEGGANISVDSNIEAVRFQKNVWNCAWSSLQGLVRSTPICFVPLAPELQIQLKHFIREIVTVGFASGLLFVGQSQPAPGIEEVANMYEGKVETEQDGIDFTTFVAYTRIMLSTQRAGGGHKMSLLIDIEQGRPIEVEVIVGAVLELARTFKVSTPLLDFVYVLLKGIQVNLVNNAKAAKESVTA